MASGPARAEGWSLRRRVPQATVVFSVLIVFVLVVVVVSLAVVRAKGNEVIDRWDPATLESQAALTSLVDQETGLRGYALGRDPVFLQPYEGAFRVERQQFAALRSNLAGDDDLLALLDAFEARASSWQEDIAEPAIDRIQSGDTTVGDDILGLPAKQSFDSLRTASQALADGIDARRAAAEASRLRVYYVIYAAVSFGILLLIAAALLTVRQLRRSVLTPITDLVDQARVVASGRLDQIIQQQGPVEIVGLAADVDAMRVRLVSELARIERARQRTIRANDELARSNADLEQFAYVASHDLSEPLRKVTNFGQLLERQYADELDDRARTYITFMVDGAKRMQNLINDLLAFSRVGRNTDHFVPVDLDDVLARAMANIERQVEALGGRVDADPLPTVPGDPTLLVALLQNLVSNAVKYSDPDRPPRVRISARQVEGAWEVSVADNGIGIDPQYAERIFAIFQRLHLRDQYGGTGIGLALCRKILDFHGGRIWLASPADRPDRAPDSADDGLVGACLTFTLPLHQDTHDDDLDDLDGWGAQTTTGDDLVGSGAGLSAVASSTSFRR